MSPEPGTVAYRETQTLGPVNRALLVCVGFVVVLSVWAPLARGMYRQLLLGQPWGTRPAPTGVLVVTGVVGLLASLLPFMLLSLTLTVEVMADELVVRLEARTPIPLLRPRRIPREEIVDATVGSEFPLGAGASLRWRRESYRVSGPDGVELVLRSGKTIFVGSQRPHELLRAVERLRAS